MNKNRIGAMDVSDLFKGLVDKAKETINPIVDKAKDAVESSELKEKAGAALETAKEKAAPVIDKVKDAAGDMADRVKDAATAVMSGEKPALEVKNELFDELDEQVAQSKDAIQEQAAAMQAKIEAMLGGKNDGE